MKSFVTPFLNQNIETVFLQFDFDIFINTSLCCIRYYETEYIKHIITHQNNSHF